MIRQNRLLGYTWNPEQKKDYEDLYQSWSASDMAAEIVNREILHQSSLAEREQRIAELRHHVEVLCGCVREGHAHEVTLARAALAATEGEKREHP